MNEKEQILKIFEDSICLRLEQIQGYSNHTLSPEETRVVELHLATCDLCNDALSGIAAHRSFSELAATLSLPRSPDPVKPVKTGNVFTKKDTIEPKHRKRLPALALQQNTFNSKTEPNLKHHHNLSWLGASGIVALLAAGGFLVWKFETSPAESFFPTLRNAPSVLHSVPAEENATTPSNPPSLNHNLALDTPSYKQSENMGNSTLLTDTSGNLSKVKDNHSDKIINSQNISAEAGKVTDITEKAIKQQLVQDSNKSLLPEERNAAKAKNTSQKSSIEPNLNKEDITKHTLSNDSGSSSEQRQNAASVNLQELATITVPAPSDFETGQQFYKNQQYEQALTSLKTVLKNKANPKYWDAVYYSALSNLALGKKGKAKRQLKEIVKAKNAFSVAAAQQLTSLKTE